MNSVLQCLAHTPPLQKYFTGERPGDTHTCMACSDINFMLCVLLELNAGIRPYEAHINPRNPDGLGGALARVYGELLEEMCYGTNSVVDPNNFKVLYIL